MKKKKYLLTRFGGQGDTAPVMAVAKYLHKKGHIVDVAFREDEKGQRQIDLLKNTDFVRKAYNFREYGPTRTRGIDWKHGFIDIRSIYSNYDEVIDYMFVVEQNNVCKTSFQTKPMDEWKKHRNSNYINWYDLHFAWANIDPSEVPDDDKRPVCVLSEEEREEIKRIRGDHSHVFVLNPSASSLARTWYQAEGLIPKLLKEYKDSLVLFWKPSTASWEAHSSRGTHKYTPTLKSTLRASVCVSGAADVYVGADTGFTHVAEGLGIPHIAIYSSVPWWTRALYYKYQTHIDKGPHTFALKLGDPHRIQEGYDNLSKKEKRILDLHGSGMSVERAAEVMNTTPEGVVMELEAIKMKIDSCERVQSKSLTSVTVDEVFELTKKLVGGIK